MHAACFIDPKDSQSGLGISTQYLNSINPVPSSIETSPLKQHLFFLYPHLEKHEWFYCFACSQSKQAFFILMQRVIGPLLQQLQAVQSEGFGPYLNDLKRAVYGASAQRGCI